MSREIKGEVGGMSAYPAEGCDPGMPAASAEYINLRDQVTLTVPEGGKQ